MWRVAAGHAVGGPLNGDPRPPLLFFFVFFIFCFTFFLSSFLLSFIYPYIILQGLAIVLLLNILSPLNSLFAHFFKGLRIKVYCKLFNLGSIALISRKFVNICSSGTVGIFVNRPGVTFTDVICLERGRESLRKENTRKIKEVMDEKEDEEEALRLLYRGGHRASKRQLMCRDHNGGPMAIVEGTS